MPLRASALTTTKTTQNSAPLPASFCLQRFLPSPNRKPKTLNPEASALNPTPLTPSVNLTPKPETVKPKPSSQADHSGFGSQKSWVTAVSSLDVACFWRLKHKHGYTG